MAILHLIPVIAALAFLAATIAASIAAVRAFKKKDWVPGICLLVLPVGMLLYLVHGAFAPIVPKSPLQLYTQVFGGGLYASMKLHQGSEAKGDVFLSMTVNEGVFSNMVVRSMFRMGHMEKLNLETKGNIPDWWKPADFQFDQTYVRVSSPSDSYRYTDDAIFLRNSTNGLTYFALFKFSD